MGHPPDAEAVILRVIHRRYALWLVLLAPVAGTPVQAQDVAPPPYLTSTAHVQIGHIAGSYFDTPNGLGLLATARAEAEIAIQHAALFARDSLYLEGMQRHVEHVLHALDPSLAPEGPGLGYGARRAAAAILQHIELAGASDDASDNVRTHAAYIAGAARSALERLDRVAALAGRIRMATSVAEALPAARELEATVRAAWLGSDADGDRRVVWAPPEGGLRHIQYHMTLLRRGEGLFTQEAFPR